MNRIDLRFAELKRERRAALMPYLPLGFPSLELSAQLIATVADAGADMIELGLPFCDPLADGPVIQRATRMALQNGTTVARSLDMVRRASGEGVTIPLILMGYYNPILQFGVDMFASSAKEAGADGLIVPDLPPEEAAALDTACRARDLDLIFLVAPTSTAARLGKITEASRGFVYVVSLTGVTGARDRMAEELPEFVMRVRAVTLKPVCVGFGIGSAESARQAAQFADGVIVGSALVSKIAGARHPLAQAREFVAGLRGAIPTVGQS